MYLHIYAVNRLLLDGSDRFMSRENDKDGFSDRPAYNYVTQVLSIANIAQKTSMSMTTIGHVANGRTD